MKTVTKDINQYLLLLIVLICVIITAIIRHQEKQRHYDIIKPSKNVAYEKHENKSQRYINRGLQRY